jgi:hypothetical protein
VSDVQDPTTIGQHLKAQWLPSAHLLAAFGLATVLLTVLAILGLHGGGIGGVALVLALVLMIGLAIAISMGFEGWLPAFFGLSLLASLNFTVERLPLTLYAFDPFLIALYSAWLVRAHQRKANPLRLSPLDGLGLAWIAWLLLTALLGRHLPTSLNGWLLYARGFLVYFYFAHALQARWQLRALIAVLVGMVALQSGLGLLQYLTRSNIGSISDLVGRTVGSVRQVGTAEGSLFRVRGTLNTDTSLAHWLEMLVPLSLSLWLAARLHWQRVLLGLIVLAGVAAQVVTFTRGGWFGLVAGVSLVLWVQFRRRLVIRRQLFAALTAAVLLVLLLLPFAALIRARLFESEQDTLAVRENLNRTALEVIVDYPITGIGLDNFVRVAPEYGTGWRWLMEGKWHKVHNVYLALASEAGPIGLLLFLVFMGVVLLTAWRGGGQEASDAPWYSVALARGLWAGLAAVLVHGLAAWGLLSYGVFPLFWMLVGLVAQRVGCGPEDGP